MTSLLASLLLAAVSSPLQAPLTVGKTYDLPKPGRFDVIAFDGKNHRVLGAHAGASSLAVLDTQSGQMQEIDTGAINGIAVSGKLNRIFVAGGNQKLVALDRETLKIVGSVPLTGPGDTMAMDSKRGEVYVGHDDGTELWAFDGTTLALKGTVTIEEAPEFVEYDSKGDRLYQNIKTTDHLQVIDPESKKVVATWTTGGMKSPHGLALDVKNGRAYAAGGNGKLVTFELATGKILATTDVATGVDQIAIDKKAGRLYCPGRGTLSVLDITGSEPKSLGDVTIPKGVHTLAVDSTTHDVWLAYGDASSAHFMQMKSSG